jgi:hypothetical protein
MKNLPIGIQSFEKLREKDYLYVDKTQLMYQLIQTGSYYFLSRPRRFGKSLLVNTLAAFFSGRKDLFQGLWVEDKYSWDQEFPVVQLSFSNIGTKEIGLVEAIRRQLHIIASSHGISLVQESIALSFKELLQKLSEKNKVVLLIDEYDKPIIDFIDDISQVNENRQILRNLYSVIKDADIHLKFVLITGVSKFSKVSIFSDLNNLNDITLDPNYSSLLGYTQKELEHYFADRIDNLLNESGNTREKLLTDIREWYNGYSWLGKEKVYNPFSILNFFSKGVFQNFWFSTGTPTFLIKTLQKAWEYRLDDLDVGSTQLDFFDIEDPDYRALLFQTGYLTIKGQPTYNIYSLGYPNKEVKDSMLQYLIGAFSFRGRGDAAPTVLKMKKALDKADIALFVSILNSLFSSIPEKIFRQRNEAAYHAIVYTTLSLMGYFIEAEVASGDGYVDAVVKTSDRIYVMEFKVGYSPEVAIAQIREKGYAESFRHDGRTVHLIGINFGKETKGVDGWLEEFL